MESTLDIYILTTNQDHDGTVLKVQADRWVPYGANSKVQYLSKSNRNYRAIKNTILNVNPDVVYINGMYSMPFVVYPLMALKKNRSVKRIIAPRGMLQKESRSIKPFKKNIYLNLLKLFYLDHRLHWHVTTEQEQFDLYSFPGAKGRTSLIGNVPSFNLKYNPEEGGIKDKIRFGTVALISPMKNIHLVLSAFSTVSKNVEYHLYGPVKDKVYWQQCQKLIAQLPENVSVQYHGALDPGDVSKTIASFDYCIQPSRSENFGHSIFEAFNQGVPVIISDQTPWKGLQEKHAGWDVDLSQPDALAKAIAEAIAMDADTYLKYRQGARQIAETYMQVHDFEKLYLELFG
jgi:glycosyltransferase involved in cell wall biosynthesis